MRCYLGHVTTCSYAVLTSSLLSPLSYIKHPIRKDFVFKALALCAQIMANAWLIMEEMEWEE